MSLAAKYTPWSLCTSASHSMKKVPLVVLGLHASVLIQRLLWRLWCWDRAVKAAGLLGQVCGYILGRKWVGDSLPAEDPLPHLEPRRSCVISWGCVLFCSMKWWQEMSLGCAEEVQKRIIWVCCCMMLMTSQKCLKWLGRAASAFLHGKFCIVYTL